MVGLDCCQHPSLLAQLLSDGREGICMCGLVLLLDQVWDPEFSDWLMMGIKLFSNGT